MWISLRQGSNKDQRLDAVNMATATITKLTVLVYTTTLLLLLLATSLGNSDSVSNTDRVAKASNDFALHLYQTHAMNSGQDNIFFSPISISTALAMTLLGARGNTAHQMGEVLKFDAVEMSDLHSSFAQLNTAIFGKSAEKYTLNKANRIFGHKDVFLTQQFLSDTNEHYDSDVSTLDFVKDVEGARRFINAWVEKETNRKIRDLLPAGSVHPMTQLVLVNAIYFKADWAKQFDPKKTYEGEFYVSETDDVQVSMMNRKSYFFFGMDTTLRCKIVELPYVGNHMNMVVILPDEIGGLGRLQTHLTQETLRNLLSTMRNMTVSVTLPKFKLEETIVMNDVLADMGMRDLFHPMNADLSGITGEKGLFVSKVIHKAFLEVNEEGSEAAAATAVTMMKRSIDLTPEFRADHPFLFFIMDAETKTIIFMGHYRKPAANNSIHVEL